MLLCSAGTSSLLALLSPAGAALESVCCGSSLLAVLLLRSACFVAALVEACPVLLRAGLLASGLFMLRLAAVELAAAEEGSGVLLRSNRR